MRDPWTSMCASLTVLVIAAAPALGNVVSLEPVRDNTLFSTDGATSSGIGTAVFSGRTGSAGGGVRQRAVLAFDVAGAVPAGATVTSVTLRLVLVGAGGPSGAEHELTLHPLLTDWGEGTSGNGGGNGAPATPGDATWLHRFSPDVFWMAPGGDFVAVPSATRSVGTTFGAYSWGPTAAMVADVQAWLDAPADAHGWLVLGNEASFSTSRKFASREEADVDARPRLVVEFVPAVSCPADVDCNGVIAFPDLLRVLSRFGACAGCAEDVTGDGTVGVDDLDAVLAAWGACG